MLAHDQANSLAQTGVHPPINSLLDALTFRLERLVAVNDRVGSIKFKETHGLSLNEWRVLGLTSAMSPATISAIRKVLVMDKGQLSRVVARLTDKGMIRSRPASDDARSVELVLTEKGEVLHAEVLKFTAERNDKVVEGLTPEECCEFLRILQKITAHNEKLSALAGLLE